MKILKIFSVWFLLVIIFLNISSKNKFMNNESVLKLLTSIFFDSLNVWSSFFSSFFRWKCRGRRWIKRFWSEWLTLWSKRSRSIYRIWTSPRNQILARQLGKLSGKQGSVGTKIPLFHPRHTRATHGRDHSRNVGENYQLLVDIQNIW